MAHQSFAFASRSALSAEIECLRKQLEEQKRRSEYYKNLWMQERAEKLKIDDPLLQESVNVHRIYQNEFKSNLNSYERNFNKFLASMKSRRSKKSHVNKHKTPSREELMTAQRELDKKFQLMKERQTKNKARGSLETDFLKSTKQELSRLEQEFTFEAPPQEPDQFLKSSTLYNLEEEKYDSSQEEKQTCSPSPVKVQKDENYSSRYSMTRPTSPLYLGRKPKKQPPPDPTKLEKKKKKSYERPKDPSEEHQILIKKRVDSEIDLWSKNKSLRILLNKIFNHPYREAGYLGPDVSFAILRKNYHRAVNMIHPDRHIYDDFETRCRNEKMFLVLQGAYERASKKRAR